MPNCIVSIVEDGDKGAARARRQLGRCHAVGQHVVAVNQGDALLPRVLIDLLTDMRSRAQTTPSLTARTELTTDVALLVLASPRCEGPAISPSLHGIASSAVASGTGTYV